MLSIKSAAMAATIFGAVAATGCGKKDNYAADTASAASTTPTAMAPDTTRKAAASKPATKKTGTKKKASKKTGTKKKASTKTTY